jgi:hypothetical protein
MKPVVLLSEPETRPDLKWVEEVAALLPEESRLGWYQNVRPWLRVLPPDDEVAHLAYSMGYLALLTRTAPALIAAERVRLTATLERLSTEMAASVKTTADYHHRLNNRLGQLPGEIAQGLRPDALADQIVGSVREQFLNCGVPEAGRLLKEEGETLRQLVARQSQTLAEFRHDLGQLGDRICGTLEGIGSSADTAKKSIDRWDHEARQVRWLHLGTTFLTGLLLGALLYWWAFGSLAVPAQTHVPETKQPQPSAVGPAKPNRHAQKQSDSRQRSDPASPESGRH